MRCSQACTFFLCFWGISHLAAQDREPSATLEVHLGASQIWGRYIVQAPSLITSGFITQPNGESDFKLTGIQAGGATSVKGILYSPGCALQTFDIQVNESRAYQYSFACEALPQLEIRGSVGPVGKRYEHGVWIEAKYVAAWAPGFFDNDDGVTTEIPIGGVATLNAQNQFRLTLPDLYLDKLAYSKSTEGDIQIFVRDQVTGLIVDQWKLQSHDPRIRPSKSGGIPIDALELNRPFGFLSATAPLPHDQFGFALRATEIARSQP